MINLRNRMTGVVIGAAVGDALGGPVEGYSPEQIVERHGGPVTGIVGPWFEDWANARPMSPYHKGDGNVTDDTLMTHALIDVYTRLRRHLTAFDLVDYFAPILMHEPRWIPELEKETVLLNRIFLAEKWIVAKGFYGHADPREAGSGNIVNCGAAMYVAPVGVVNAGDPEAAYAEAIDLTAAHQSSYGREAAGVFAAAVAAALAEGATPDSAVDAAQRVARDGTADAITAVVGAARAWNGSTPLHEVLRDAVRPFDTVGETYRQPLADARRPSRTKSIEELPIALGFVAAHGADWRTTVLGAVNYGRDCDSIATMAGALLGGIGGTDAVPAEWASAVAEASRMDIEAVGADLAEVAHEVLEADLQVTQRKASSLTALLGGAA
ncbi:MAG: ADP-ribosylglycohydrolase family protein [Dermabacteraceae bacterium]